MTHRTLETDVAIIGAGTAGLNARREVERAGKRWLLIEAGAWGTTCARVGCMPSKLLIAAGEAAHAVTHAGTFGVRVDPAAVTIDGAAVMRRVQRERDRFVGFVVADRAELPPDRVLTGRARFTSPTTLIVTHPDGATTAISMRASVIATGSTPRIPPALASLGACDTRDNRLYTNDRIFERADLPRSLAVLGTGVIGLELGQAFHRLGVPTTLFAHHRALAGLTDPAVRDKAEAVLGRELDLRLDHTVTAAEATANGVRLTWLARRDASSAPGEGLFGAVLVATGRAPNLGDLGLETTGLALETRLGSRDAAFASACDVPVHDPHTMQCGDLPIFIAGDASADHFILHEASDEGRTAGRNAALYPAVAPSPRRTPLAITFCDPAIARVGTCHPELDTRYPGDWIVGAVSYDNQGRSRIAAKNAGLVHVYAQRSTGRLLGAELFAPRAEHLAHLLAWAIQSEHTVASALALPVYHPVFEEGLRTALQALARALAA